MSYSQWLPESPWWNSFSYDVPTPALVIDEHQVKANIDQTIHLAAGAHRLFPHVKTHKMSQIIELFRKHGVENFKAATSAELALCLRSGAKRALLAFPCFGPHIDELIDLANEFPERSLAMIFDSTEGLNQFSSRSSRLRCTVEAWIDLDVGMGRTGVKDEKTLGSLARAIDRATNLELVGLHCYDGHVHQRDVEDRRQAVTQVVTAIDRAIEVLDRPLEVITGGSPSFPIHAQVHNYYLSPGTTALWDSGYGQSYPEMGLVPAGAVMSRVIGHGRGRTITLDLGHKALAPEMPWPRAFFPQLGPTQLVSHSEEHLVIEIQGNAPRPPIGQIVVAIPTHICPTVSRYNKAIVVESDGEIHSWNIAATTRDPREVQESIP